MFFGLDLIITEGSRTPVFAVRFEAGPWQQKVTTFPPAVANSEG